MRRKSSLVFFIAEFVILLSHAVAYDPMDPQGNVTIRWDILERTDGRYTARVTLNNYQLYRHVESPGWRLSWTWPGNDVIWYATGAEATEQGNCSMFQGNLPHSCEKNPVMVDLLPGAPYNLQTTNCCKGGVLSSLNQDPSKSIASFQINVGDSSIITNSTEITGGETPSNFSIGVAGYTCSDLAVVAPSRFPADGGRRFTQALDTWEVICSFSQFRESKGPLCCVSLSAFYNETIVPCPYCSCGCQNSELARTCRSANGVDAGGATVDPTLVCTKHMCPVHVHWHVKVNYVDYWRVKLTIHNLNLARNYSDWNIVVQHPNLKDLTQVFSFNYKPIILYGDTNDTGMLWGIQYFNDLLLQPGDKGNVQTEILLRKGPEFTFIDGWAFPRKVSFNGHDCVMPSPDSYPFLPQAAGIRALGSAAAAAARRKPATPPPLFFILTALLLLL